MSERRACLLVDQHRSTNRHQPDPGTFERRLVARLHQLAEAHPQEGYKTICRRLRWKGWRVNHKRVWRLWRLEGLKQPEKQSSGKHAEGGAENAMWKRRAEHPDHIWAYDFMSGHTSDGRGFRILNVVDEYIREIVSCTVARSIGSTRVEQVLAATFTQRRRKPEILRCDNGRQFIAAKLTGWLADEGVECAFIEKGRPNQNGIVERLNGLMRRHVLDVEDLATLLEARVVISGLDDRIQSASTPRRTGRHLSQSVSQAIHDETTNRCNNQPALTQQLDQSPGAGTLVQVSRGIRSV